MGKRAKQGGILCTALFKPIITVKMLSGSPLSTKAANDLTQAFLYAGILTETTGIS